jgi:hypothetical protein
LVCLGDEHDASRVLDDDVGYDDAPSLLARLLCLCQGFLTPAQLVLSRADGAVFLFGLL